MATALPCSFVRFEVFGCFEPVMVLDGLVETQRLTSAVKQENAKDCGGAAAIRASLFLLSSSLLLSQLLHSWTL